MTLKVCSVVFFSIFSLTAFAQYSLTGTVVSSSDSTGIFDCVVYLNDGKKSSITDNRGKFLFTDLPNGTYTLHFTSLEFKYIKSDITISNANTSVRVMLDPREEILEEVVISDLQTDFGFTRMRGVENMGIYEGKKSEVIIPEQLVANLATNNARQVYARVAGLNIWENDGAGLQLSIGGRGLDPNRTANFNVRQNGYDISADALGYPESYYTPPIEGIGRIEIVRGAASLQYGTQFGGLINFIMKKPVADRKLELIVRQTGGSYGFYNSFTSASGTVKKLSYYTFFQYKRGDGWRENSDFNSHNFYGNFNYQVSDKTKIGFDVTKMGYLAHQPGGATMDMFRSNPRESRRERNWFKVNWNLFALNFDHKFNTSRELNVRVFGLDAYRYSLGFVPKRPGSPDDNTERDLIKGNFQNWGTEARFLNRYQLGKVASVVLVGSRYYQGFNHSKQGLGSDGTGADFNFINEDEFINYDYNFPNKNLSLFAENIFYLNDRLSITPGFRFEHISTTADGFYGNRLQDNAGNVYFTTTKNEYRKNNRRFLLSGIGVSYRPTSHMEVYTNTSQNYRSITFNDMRIISPSSDIDPALEDEKGFSFDLGMRSDGTVLYNYDVSVFYLDYNNRIGEIRTYDSLNFEKRIRTNVGHAVVYGVEAYGEIDFLGFLRPGDNKISAVVFSNVAFISSGYRSSAVDAKYQLGVQDKVEGKTVEFVPDINIKTGLRLGYNNLKASFQYTYLSEQYTDATNSRQEDPSSGIFGIIPSYDIMDVSVSYQFKRFRIEGNINNVADRMYFTRRATGYPGPGILASDGRSYFITLQARI